MDLDLEISRHGNAVLKYCFGILCDYHEAQDAAQETFAKAYSARKTLREAENFKAWLFKIAYNVCMNILRKKRRLFVLPADVREETYTMDEPFIDPALTNALLILSPTERALFYSRAVDDMDFAQLEALYNTRAATLRKRYERAKKRLRAHLSGIGYVD